MEKTLPKLKVIKNDGPETADSVKAKGLTENNEKAMVFEEQMVDKQTEFATKKYKIKTSSDAVTYLTEDFYNNVEWNGYECYAISETNSIITKLVSKIKPSKTGKVTLALTPDILQAVFHFMKSHKGTGIESARKHRVLCEDFSTAMAELNNDHKEIRDLAVSAEAAKHGITTDEYERMAAENAPQQPNGGRMPS